MSWEKEVTWIADQPQKPPTTPRQLEKLIAGLAIECGIVLNDGHAGFEAPKAARVRSVPQERGYAEAIWPWRRLMAECLNYLTIQSLTYEALLGKNKDQSNNFVRAAWSLSTKAASDALCVLELCDRGFVPQASIVARSCIEAIEVLSAFTIKRDYADSFVAAQTPDEANHNWYRVLRKARATMDAAFANVVEIDKDTQGWRDDNRRFLGAHSHPSFVIPLLNSYTAWDNNKPGHPLLPARTKTCVRVFQPIADACFEYASLLLLSTSSPRSAQDGQRRASTNEYVNRGFFKEDWLDSYAAFGHTFIQSLFVFYIAYQGEPPFSLWREGKERMA